VVSLDFSVIYSCSYRPYNGPGVDSAPRENEYQEHFLGERRPVREADILTTFMCRMSWKSGSLNSLGPSGPHRPVRDCFTFSISTEFNQEISCLIRILDDSFSA